MKKLDTVPNGEMIIYENSDGKTIIDVRFDEDTLWLTQMQMADLFGVQKAAISKHLKNIFESEELIENAVVSILETTAADGKNYPTKYYNLDAVIAVGYRVNSKRATAFRIWATNILKDYIKKGFAMDDDRLKELGGGGYFKELLERIRDIRASEKVFYRQVLEIYATSIDYDPKAEVSVLFFKRVQNKIHYGVHGHTAAELIMKRADATKDNMGLTAFEGAKVRKKDVDIAKNYLNEEEMSELNRVVTMYLDFAEDQARRHIPMYMKDWEEKLNSFLNMTGREVLSGAGHVSAEQAKKHALKQYEIYDEHRLQMQEEQVVDELLQNAKDINMGKN